MVNRHPRVTGVVVGILLLGIAWACRTTATERPGVSRFERLGLTTADLVDVYGLNIYKFRLNTAQTGGKYRVVLRERDGEGSPWENLFSEEISAPSDPNLFLLVSFTREDGQFGGALLRRQRRVDFGLRLCTQDRCYVGMFTAVPTPLGYYDNLILQVHQSGSEGDQVDPGCLQLLTIGPSSRWDKKNRPRAELLLMRQ
jgi:hypothetical protein